MGSCDRQYIRTTLLSRTGSLRECFDGTVVKSKRLRTAVQLYLTRINMEAAESLNISKVYVRVYVHARAG